MPLMAGMSECDILFIFLLSLRLLVGMDFMVVRAPEVILGSFISETLSIPLVLEQNVYLPVNSFIIS